MATQGARSAVPRLWHGGSAVRPEARKAGRRRRKVFALQAAIMALAGAIVGMLYWLKPIPTPRLLPLISAATESPALVPLPMASADLRGFEGLRSLTHRGKATTSEDRIRLVSDLDDLKTVRGVPVIVFLRAYSRVNLISGVEPTAARPGQLMILPADADPVNPAKWLSLRTALKALADCRSSRKLLLLDIVQGPGDPAFDLLTPGLVGRITDDLKAVPDPYRLTLTAGSPGEPALASDDLGRSVFGFYIEEGLRGWADVDATAYHHDGVVTAADLAGYVAAHVDRWARLNRQTRQRPILYLDAQAIKPEALNSHDFPLAVLARGRPMPHLGLASPRVYPDWLTNAWRRLDHWRLGGSDRVAPWAFLRAEAALLWADQGWRAGTDPVRVRAFLAAELSKFATHQEKVRATPRPDVHALAVLFADGLDADPGLVADLRGFAEKAAGPVAAASGDKKAEGPAPPVSVKSTSDRDLALAVFPVAADLAEPTAGSIVALDALLSARGGPRFVETLTLHRLAEAAQADLAAWSPALARRILALARKANHAENRPNSLDWVRSTLDDAAQARHDAEILFRERGFALPAEADTAFGRAERLYDIVLSAQDAVESARSASDAATFVLPACAAYLEDAPQLEGPWSAAVAAARELDADLRPGKDRGETDTSPPAADLTPRVDALRQKANALRDRLAEIRQAIDARTAGLTHNGPRDEPEALTCSAIDALLSTPFPLAEERPALWSARHRLSRRLAGESLKLDQSAAWTAAADDPDSDDESEVTLSAAASRRARRSIDLLSLGGLNVSTLDVALGQASATDTDADWLTLAIDLRRAWVDRLPAAFKAALAADLPAADRLSRLLPPFASFTAREELEGRLSDLATNPARRLRLAREARLWAWLADHYQYDANDLDNSDLLNEAARGVRNLAPPKPSASVRFGPLPEAPELTPEHASAELILDLVVSRPDATRPEVQVDLPGLETRWLQVSPTDPASSFPVQVKPDPTSGRVRLPIRVAMVSQGEGPAGILPQGFLVRARVNGRDFHARVPIALSPASERLKLLLSDDPETPTAPRGDLRLRPVAGRQVFHLYLFNPTSRVRKVAVSLKIGDLIVPGASATVTVAPGKVEKVDFPKVGAATPSGNGPATAPAEPPLPELKKTLGVIVADADHADRVLAQRLIRVEIASAAEYVRVSASKFQPTGPGAEKNALTITLAASGTLSGPPCLAELVLPPERIPVLIGTPADGTFRGVVPTDGTGLTLRASGLKLAEFGSEKGTFYVNIDGRKRALIFRTSFASHGDASTPRLDFEPALRLRGDDAAPSGTRFPIDVEVDNPPPSSTLDVSLGRIGPNGFEPDTPLLVKENPYRRRIGFGVREGALAFEAGETDWTIPVETSGVEGRRAIRARIYRIDGTLVREALRNLTLDAGSPSGVQFVDLPAQVKKGTTLTVRASGRPSESGTRQVVFFLGAPTADGKRPSDAKVINGRPTDAEQTTWSADLKLPDDKKGPTPISVQFLSGVGRSTFATAEIDLLDTDPVLFGDLRVRLTEGDRPQAGLAVYVFTAKGAFARGGVTGADGTFSTDHLPAGPYTVLGYKPSTPADGRVSVNVVAGTTTTADVPLQYRVR